MKVDFPYKYVSLLQSTTGSNPTSTSFSTPAVYIPLHPNAPGSAASLPIEPIQTSVSSPPTTLQMNCHPNLLSFTSWVCGLEVELNCTGNDKYHLLALVC